MGKITILLNPQQRQAYIDQLLSYEGLSHIKEDPLAAYCPISLTNTPDEIKSMVKERQKILMEQILAPSGITAYDPASAPYSPDTNLSSLPNEVYQVDSGKIVGARFFVGHNILPSTGQGVEAEKAKVFNRIAVVLLDKKIRISRMQPHRTIYLQYDDFAGEAKKFVPVFEMLKKYEPGMGFNGPLPVLLGFRNDKAIDLEDLVYKTFPDLVYRYDGTVPTCKFRLENPEAFQRS